MSNEGQYLAPQDWDQFRDEMHQLLDACLKRMKHARDLPWQPKPSDIAGRLSLDTA